ncbi:Lon family ATP-dependent protease [Desulfosporosinus sp. PR]|uniref:Lon family ATP-dependent protease n=1 Tax=Candidatus Desulfosporosinus nitrosoreducens TaxID=3401928 RepID=UPI0027EE3334|nr:Lon family ATP-dependent protease [Desulfosporosinus sp. PR]MDQ7092487.1 Lon family ATP-dependent protease [Desulfosporosinus sp. PR]
MKGILRKWLNRTNVGDRLLDEEEWSKEVEALYSLAANFYGADKLVLKASKLEALTLMRSEDLVERIAGLRKIVMDDPTIQEFPKIQDIPKIIDEIEDQMAELIARRSIEERLERVVSEKMQERHEDYVKEIKIQVLQETAGPENAQTLKKLAILEKMNTVSLNRSAAEVLRPQTVEEIIGQESAVQALLAKLATPYPQHILIYGPPGVGKTSAARVALETVKSHANSPFAQGAPFIEVDGTTLRWDPRDVTNPLMGSVHDPIYQGSKRDLADTGVPEPKMGLVSDAHGGILFIDEIGDMDPLLLNKLLKVLEDKRVTFDSSYYDPSDPQVPQWIKKLFDEGAPADFVLIGATTRDPMELNPALRSRCSEVFFIPLEPKDIQHIIRQAALKLEVALEDNVPEIISEYVIEGRKANSILTDAYGLARYRSSSPEAVKITCADVQEVLRSARLTPYVFRKAQPGAEIGRILGLGVAGFLGSVLEIEAIAFPSEDEKGTVRFNETAGSMARDAVFNATAVIRELTGENLRNYDVHVNVVGGARIDGPSAGLATTLAIYSALKQIPLRQDVAITGEISIQGKVKPVGGIYEKIFGAKQADVRKVIIPLDNMVDVPQSLRGIEVVGVNTVNDAIKQVFSTDPKVYLS